MPLKLPLGVQAAINTQLQQCTPRRRKAGDPHIDRHAPRHLFGVLAMPFPTRPTDRLPVNDNAVRRLYRGNPIGILVTQVDLMNSIVFLLPENLDHRD